MAFAPSCHEPIQEDTKAFLAIEVWLRRGATLRRLYGSRAGDADLSHPGKIRLVLQPVERGEVLAWKPVWEAWVGLIEAQGHLDCLLVEGWEPMAAPRQEAVAQAPRTPEERKAHRRAWDRQRKARARAQVLCRAVAA